MIGSAGFSWIEGDCDRLKPQGESTERLCAGGMPGSHRRVEMKEAFQLQMVHS